jgi:hypothetical protein
MGATGKGGRYIIYFCPSPIWPNAWGERKDSSSVKEFNRGLPDIKQE